MLSNRVRFGWRRRWMLSICALVSTLAACQSPAPPPTVALAVPSAPPRVEQQPIPDGPVLLRDSLTLRKVVDVAPGNIRLARNPRDNGMYLLNPDKGLFRVDLNAASFSNVAATSEMVTDAVPSGLAFGPDGTAFVVANRKVGTNRTQGLIRRGVAGTDGSFTWETLASTEPYPMSSTPFDHLFNGIVISGDGKWAFVNSGSRTDHGEVEDSNGAFPNTRDVALTAKIFRLPTTAKDLRLPNDLAALSQQGMIFATGTRNAYDLEFAPNGDLFATDNGPDADYPDELNWIREGRNYGFPWRFGNQDNPQQFADYDSSKDVRLSRDFAAVQSGSYRNDPTFPKPPGPFTDPVLNRGPDATQYRGDDGQARDAAAEGKPLYSFTPHRSPLGLVFATSASLPSYLRPTDTALSMFMLSWGAAGGTLSDKGQDLLHLQLLKRGDNYEAITTAIARGFKNPIDAVMIENRLYVLEYGEQGALWEITFG